MSFTRVNGGGWGVNDPLTSSQQNALDIDHANAIDKTGDNTISGVIQWAGAASGITLGAGCVAGLICSSGSKVDVSGNLNVKTGGTATCAAGATFVVNSACTTTINLGNGSSVVVPPGSTGNVTINTAADVKYASAQARTILYSLADAIPQVAATFGPANPSSPPFGAIDLQSNGALQGQVAASTIVLRVPRLNGATLSTATLRMTVGSGHNGQPSPPANMPSFRVYKVSNAGVLTALGTAAAFASPATGTIWYAGGAVQLLAFTATTSNVVDTSSGDYFIVFSEEWGASSFTGNTFVSVTCAFTAIADLTTP